MQEPLSGDAPRTDEAAVQRLRGWLHLLVLLLITFCLVIGALAGEEWYTSEAKGMQGVELQLGLFRGEIAIDVPTNRSRLSVNVEFTVTPDCTLQVALAPDVYYEVDPKLRRCVQLRVATALVFLCLLLGAATAIAIVVFRVRRVYEDAHGKGLVVALGVQFASALLALILAADWRSSLALSLEDDTEGASFDGASLGGTFALWCVAAVFALAQLAAALWVRRGAAASPYDVVSH